MPPISGTSSRVGYAITNLDLSGFRLRKEDVEVQLVDLSGGLEVAVKEGGTGTTNATDGGSGGVRSDGAPGGGAVDSGSRGRGASAGGGGVGTAYGKDPAAVPWATSAVDGSPSRSRKEGRGSSVISERTPKQRRQAAYDAVLGGASSPRLPEELQVSWEGRGGREEGFDGGAGVLGEEGGGVAVHLPAPPPPKEEMAPAEVLRVVARGVRAEFKTLQWACRQVFDKYWRVSCCVRMCVCLGRVS